MIASKAGITKAAIYRHFASREDLDNAMYNCVYEDLDKGLLMGLQMTIDEMTEMENPVHHATIEARDWLKGKR